MTDSSAPNSPELTRLSGEQAEERTVRELDELKAVRKWMEENGEEPANPYSADLLSKVILAYHKHADCAECSRLASRVLELEADVTRWQLLAGKLDCKKCTPGLASRVEELEKGLREIYTLLDGPLSASDKVYCLKLLKRMIGAGAHAEEKE